MSLTGWMLVGTGPMVQGQNLFHCSFLPWRCLKNHVPVRVIFQGLDRLLDIADVPELDLAVVSAAGQVILPVGVEVQVTHQQPMGVLYTVDLTEEDRDGERDRKVIKMEREHRRGEVGEKRQGTHREKN